MNPISPEHGALTLLRRIKEDDEMKKLIRTPLATGILFVLALVLLVFGSVGGTRAALNLQSQIYESQLKTSSIAVKLQEDGQDFAGGVMKISTGDMAQRAGDNEFKLGKVYDLPLRVYNSGVIEEYVRVTVYRYWVSSPGTTSGAGWFNGSGTKDRSLDPELIKLTYPDGWAIDDAASTLERKVYYYASPVAHGDSVPFPMTVKVDSSVVNVVTIDPQTGVFVYTYNGKGFVLEIQADAVQTHNGDEARVGSWGQKGT